MISKPEAKYVAKTIYKSERCGNCSMYRYGGTCTLVRGEIKSGGWCKHWEAKKK